jgi:hypothetical protein
MHSGGLVDGGEPRRRILQLLKESEDHSANVVPTHEQASQTNASQTILEETAGSSVEDEPVADVPSQTKAELLQPYTFLVNHPLMLLGTSVMEE